MVCENVARGTCYTIMDEAYEGSSRGSQLVVHDKLGHGQLLHELTHRLIDHETSTFPEAYLSKINPITNANFAFVVRFSKHLMLVSVTVALYLRCDHVDFTGLKHVHISAQCWGNMVDQG